MNLTKYYPSQWFRHDDVGKALASRAEENPRDVFHSELDRMFDDFFTSFGSPLMPSLAGRGNMMLKPKLDLSATDTLYTVAVELPGVDEKDVAIEINQDILTISGEKKMECEKKDDKNGVYRMERSYGSFHRTLALPEDTDKEGIKAEFDKGVLRISIPRTTPRDTKKIEIARG